MNKVLLFVLTLAPVLIEGQDLYEIPQNSIIGCGENKIFFIDPEIQDDEKSVFWSWEFDESNSNIPESFVVRGVDECKPIDNNQKILFTSGGSSGILDIESRNIEFYAKTYNAHSADTLPGGYIAIANSLNPKGNSLVLYHRSKPDEVLWQDTLYFGHGVIWNKKYNRLYALGYDKIVEYSFNSEAQDGEYMNKESEYKMPDGGGHDLSYVDADTYLVSTNKSVFVFDLNKKNFHEFKRMKGLPEVKSVNYDRNTGRLTYTKGEESWWTSNIYTENPHRVIYIPDFRLYKTRIVK